MAVPKFAERMAAQMVESMGGNRLASARIPADMTARPIAAVEEGEDIGVKRDRRATMIDLGRIKALEQVRTEFDDDAIRGLADSIQENGLLQPILVRWAKEHDRYVIISGECRYRAMVQLGREDIAATVTKESDPAKLKAMQLVENLHRKDLKPMELARGFRAWMDDNNASAATAGKQFGVSEATVLRAVNLLNLPEPVQLRVETGEMSPTLANEISKAPAEHRQEIADRIAGEKLTVAEASRVVDEVRTASRARGKAKGRGAKSKPATSRTWKGPGGLRIEATRAKGLDVLALLETLRSAVAEIESETDPAADLA